MPRTTSRKPGPVTDADGTAMSPVSAELAAAIAAVAAGLRAEFDWDHAYEYRGRGKLVANRVPFAHRHDPVVRVGPPGRARPGGRKARDPAAETVPREAAGVEVPAGLAAAIREADGRMIAEFGANMAWVVLALDKTVAASNGRDGFVPPRVRAG